MSQSFSIHPTAIISPEAKLGEDVQIGPFCVIEGKVELGDGCVIHPHSHLIGPMTLGTENQIFTGATLGGQPQDLSYKNEETRVEIGNRNIFRENVTIHRGTARSGVTRIGDDNFFMACSHVGHDSIVGDRCVLANNALLAGHTHLHDGVFLSGGAVVHQFCTLGRLSMLAGLSGSSKDVPPFIMQQNINLVCGLNIVGLRRAGVSTQDITVLRQAYRILYREGLLLPNGLAQVEQQLGESAIVQELVHFIRNSKRGINMPPQHTPRSSEAA